MNHEQNIADLIEQLKVVAEKPSEEIDTANDKSNKRKERALSADDLQKKLKKQYFASGSSSSEERGPYDLDADLLNEFALVDENESYEENIVEEPVEEVVEEVVEEPIEEIVEETVEDVIAEDETTEEDLIEEPVVEEETVSELYEEEIELAEDQSEALLELEAIDDYEDMAAEDEVYVEETLKEEEVSGIPKKVIVENVEFSDDDIYGKPVESVRPTETATYEPDVIVARESEVEFLDEDIYESNRPEIADDTAAYESIVEETAKTKSTVINDEPEIKTEVSSAPFNEFTYQEKTKPISFKSLMMDYGRSDPTPDEDVTPVPEIEKEDEVDTPDVGDILSDFSDPRVMKQDSINSEMHRLMSSLGCEEELNDISREALGEIFEEFNCVEDDVDEEQRQKLKMEQRRERYKKDNVASTIRLVICALGVVALFLYDMLPLLGVEFYSLCDYTTYPGAYIMIGFQLLLICAICLWKPMIEGIKKLATPRPNIYSMVAVIVFANLLYDLVLVISGSYEPDVTPVFHFIGGIIILCVAITELILQLKEAKAYDIYCSDVAKYTLSKDCGAHSIAEKMYNGGFAREKEIYAPASVSDPDGFDRVIRENSNFSKINALTLPIAAVVCIITGIVLMITGRSPQMASAAAMVILYSVVPVGSVIAIALPLEAAASRLTKRGIAITSRKMIRKYADANVLVFMDTHLFKKCSSKDVGFVCYEKSQTNGVLAGLEILYSRIGGPMSFVFSNIPEEIKAKRIRVRRVAKNGIEALIDKSHVLIVGDAEFMRRYGVNFSGVEAKSKATRNATLYISYDGRASAKLSAVYEVDPIFDMLIERLSAEGGHCVIETYDPVINTTFVAAQRRKGRAPISVVHKNAADINRSADMKPKRISDNGIIVVSSRFKLIEAVVWCSRIVKIEKIANILTYCFAGLGFVLTMLAAIFAFTPFMAQYLLLLYALLPMIIVGVVTFTLLPQKDYFTLKGLAEQDNKN